MRKYNIVKNQNFYLPLSIVVVVISLVCLALWGLQPGLDFTGGSLMEVKFTADRPDVSSVYTVLKSAELKTEPVLQPSGTQSMLIRFQEVDEATHQKVLSLLQEKFPQNAEQSRFESIGPAIGKELKVKAFYAVLLACLAIVAYVAWAFRGVSWPVKSWKYGVFAIVALIHDIVIVMGVFAVLGRFLNVEVGLPFIAALLTILGYSVNDTIVVFDRIRENLGRLAKTDFETVVDRSIDETFARSINTSVTVLIVLILTFFFGGASIKYFALALIIGVFCGTYSSIFIASPLLVLAERYRLKKQ